MKKHFRHYNSPAFGLLALSSAMLEPAHAQGSATPPPAVDWSATYISDGFANLSGGRKEGARIMGKLSLTLDADMSPVGMEGVRFFADIQHVHGESLTDDLVGDAQVVSNIDAPTGLRPMEAYFTFAFGPDARGRIKAGLIDLNADFDAQSHGAFFLNSSHGIAPEFSQSGLNGPSIFPTSASAVTFAWQGEGWTGRLGFFDAVAGDPDRPGRTVLRFPGETGLLMVGEVDFDLGGSNELQFGAWHYTSRFERIDDPARTGRSSGAYAMAEGVLVSSGNAELGVWIRGGVASDRVNPIGLYLGGGATFGTDARMIGLAVAHAKLGDPAVYAGQAAGAKPRRAETAIELSYAHRLHDRIMLQPDIQYIINPGWDRTLDNALVAGLRLHLTLF